MQRRLRLHHTPRFEFCFQVPTENSSLCYNQGASPEFMEFQLGLYQTSAPFTDRALVAELSVSIFTMPFNDGNRIVIRIFRNVNVVKANQHTDEGKNFKAINQSHESPQLREKKKQG